MGWEHEGQQAGSWDREVLGFDEAWKDAETRSNESSQEDLQVGQAEKRNEASLFKARTDYPRKLDKGKGRAVDPEEV
jgi:hypothetical protein